MGNRNSNKKSDSNPQENESPRNDDEIIRNEIEPENNEPEEQVNPIPTLPQISDLNNQDNLFDYISAVSSSLNLPEDIVERANEEGIDEEFLKRMLILRELESHGVINGNVDSGDEQLFTDKRSPDKRNEMKFFEKKKLMNVDNVFFMTFFKVTKQKNSSSLLYDSCISGASYFSTLQFTFPNCEKLHVSCCSPINGNISRGIRNHVYYYEVKIIENSSQSETCAIGIGYAKKYYRSFIGWRDKSIGYHSDNGCVYDDYPNVPKELQKSGMAQLIPYKKNDVVGCGVNAITGDLFFTLNGSIVNKLKYKRIIFRSSDDLKNRRNFFLYPTITVTKTNLHGNQEELLFELNIGKDTMKSPFIYSPMNVGTPFINQLNCKKNRFCDLEIKVQN